MIISYKFPLLFSCRTQLQALDITVDKRICLSASAEEKQGRPQDAAWMLGLPIALSDETPNQQSEIIPRKSQ